MSYFRKSCKFTYIRHFFLQQLLKEGNYSREEIYNNKNYSLLFMLSFRNDKNIKLNLTSIAFLTQVYQCCILKTERKWMLLLNNYYTTVSGHFFAICMFIFHKPEVQMVILICSTSLNFIWFKSYGLKRSLRPIATLAKWQKIATDKWPFYDHFWLFFHQLYVHLSQNWGSDGHFRCWLSLNLNWYKCYDTKSKKEQNAKNPIELFFYKIAKTRKWKYLHFVS